jgi:hypothetical protein
MKIGKMFCVRHSLAALELNRQAQNRLAHIGQLHYPETANLDEAGQGRWRAGNVPVQLDLVIGDQRKTAIQQA